MAHKHAQGLIYMSSGLWPANNDTMLFPAAPISGDHRPSLGMQIVMILQAALGVRGCRPASKLQHLHIKWH